MSKELPYFKFYPTAWLTGDITLEAMELQGVFINVCCTYWSKECRVAMAGLKARYGEAIDRLSKSGLIKEKGGFAVINFLDEQWVELYARHQKNVENGVKGAEKKWGKNSHPLAYRRDKIREDKIREDKIREENIAPETFKIRTKIGAKDYFMTPTETMKHLAASRFETTLMNNLRGLNTSKAIADFDAEFPIYDFEDINHLFNKFVHFARNGKVEAKNIIKI